MTMGILSWSLKIQYTGASMNTARSLGPTLVNGHWDKHYLKNQSESCCYLEFHTMRSIDNRPIFNPQSCTKVYWIGPLLGGIVAGLLYENMFAANSSWAKTRACFLASDYDDDKYQAHKLKIRVVEEVDDNNDENSNETNDGVNDDKIEMRHLRNSVH
ncbi:hypothetical protein LOTGIDRAFT_170144 [Lottia gigantea]|uniref:Aquaporin n=1 Tax=Lottia gigantea TaxID=225164 RepID=V3YW41_LOTGI|nr:hypothetical protein LOTGIDRAFT_170144 [Lottia gigantea]ESO82233.1 hypothetical protein LOTGIDRAFT_170144 [Lottia gigantea]